MLQSQRLKIQRTISRAKKATKKGKIAVAVELYTAVLELQPEHPIAKRSLCKLQKDIPCNQSEQAQKANRSRDQISALANLYNSNKMEATEQACRNFVKGHPESIEALNILGASLRGQGKLKEAIAVYNNITQINPDFADAYSNRGNALKELLILDEALENYQKAIQLNPKNAVVFVNYGQALQSLGRLDEALDNYEKSIQLNSDYVVAYLNKGNALRALGKSDEALESYGKALRLKPDYIEAYNNRGIVFQDLGKFDDALKDYKKILDLNPGHLPTQHIVNSLRGHDTKSAPKEYVEAFFDSYANDFEHNLVERLGYKMPTSLKEALIDRKLAPKKFNKAVDLGCGTGLVGIEFRDLVDTFVGIDLSIEMLRKAKEKNIYDKLVTDELVSGLNKTNTNFDLFISADVFVYVGDLIALFEAVARYANSGALFIFSTEHMPGNQYKLQKTGRFAHSKDYITLIAENFNFQLDYFEKCNLRKENNTWIIGGLYILKNHQPA